MMIPGSAFELKLLLRLHFRNLFFLSLKLSSTLSFLSLSSCLHLLEPLDLVGGRRQRFDSGFALSTISEKGKK